MWLLGRLEPDYKSIAESRRMHREAVTEAGAELVGFARSVGLVRGEWIAIDGSKFQAASSARSVREREAMKRYLEQLEQSDEQDEVVIDPGAVAAALEKLKSHPEPEARFMRAGNGHVPAYNVQAAVDAEHALIVAQQVTTEATDNRSLLPMAEAARQALGEPDSVSTWSPTPTIPMASRPNDASNRESCRTCQPTAPSTTRETAHCSTAAGSIMTRRRTLSAVPMTRLWYAYNCRAKTAV